MSMEAGLYKVYYKVKGDGNHADTEPAWVFVTIQPKTVSSPVITLPDETFTYNGSAQKFEDDKITVKDGADTIPASEYTVTYSNNVNAETATVHIKDNNGGNYTVNGSAAFEIGKAAAGFATEPEAKSLTYNGSAQTLIKAGVPKGGTAVYWLDGGAPSAGLPTGTDSGSYKVYYQVLGDSNHTDSTPGSLDVTIGKNPVTDPTVELSSTRFRYNGSEQKPTVTVRDGGGYVIAANEYDVTYTSVDPTASEGSAGTAKPVPASTVNAGRYYVVVTSKENNYGEFQKVVEFEITPAEQTPLTITGKPSLVHYGDLFSLGTAGGSGNGAITWSSGDSNIGKTLSVVRNQAADTEDTPGLTVKDSEGNIIPSNEYTVEVITDNWKEGTEFTVKLTAKENGNYKFETPNILVSSDLNEGNISGDEGDSGVSGGGPSIGGGSSGGSSGSSSSGGSSGSSSSSGSTNVPPAAAEPGRESASIQTSVRDGAASTVVNGAAGDELVDEAIADRSENVVIKPEITGDVTKTEVSIPASAVGRLGSKTDAALTVSTPVADVTIPNGALEALSGAGGAVGVAAERVENTVVLTLTADGRDVGNLPGGLTLTVSVEDPGPGTVAVILYEDGTRETIRRSVAGDGAVRIPLSGSATVEIVGDNSKEFTDVSPDSWACGAVAFASAHELFNGTGKTTFSPELAMSRGMLAVVLHNLESNPETAFNGVFADVESSAWYAEGVSWALNRGIVTGYGNGSFGAADSITREQLAVMLWRYAGSPAVAGNGLNFTDAGNTSSWALEAMSWAVENGIINGHGNGILDPGGPATRAQAAQMMKNFIENI